MTRFDRILVPVDLTDKNRQAIATARDLAAPSAGTVVLLHVIETLDLPAEELGDFYQTLEARARSRLAEYAGGTPPGAPPVETAIRFGKRAPEIVAYAREHDVDLIILTSHRLDADDLGRSLMTISHQVAIAADPPVLLIR